MAVGLAMHESALMLTLLIDTWMDQAGFVRIVQGRAAQNSGAAQFSKYPTTSGLVGAILHIVT